MSNVENKTRTSRMKNLNILYQQAYGFATNMNTFVLKNYTPPPPPPPTPPPPPPPPPYGGTAVDSEFEVIFTNDESTFTGLRDLGLGKELMYDSRSNKGNYEYIDAHIFKADYTGGKVVHIAVNAELDRNIGGIFNLADIIANKYAAVVGRMPKIFRDAIDTLWIHDGEERWFSGLNEGTRFIGIYISSYPTTTHAAILHETCHLYIDKIYSNDQHWLDAQKNDGGKFISTYAKENPQREDLAESFTAYFAIRYRKDRISIYTFINVIKTIPNRINFFESLELDMSPYQRQ